MAAVHRDWAWDRPGDARALPVDVERRGALVVLRAAMRDLGDADRTILVGRHVHGATMTSIAELLDLHPHAVPGRLRRAEENLAAALAAAHARHVAEPECRAGRAVMHDYLAGRLLPHRQRRLEVHMNDCARCTRAFVDVCDVSWALREAGNDAVVEGAPADVSARPTPIAARANRRETAVAAAALIAVTVVGATTHVADQTGEPAGQVLEAAGVDEGGPETVIPGNREAPPPPSIRPSNRQPRPSTTPKDDAAAAAQTVAGAVRTTPAAAGADPGADTGLAADVQETTASSGSKSAAGASSSTSASALARGVEHADAAAADGLAVAVTAAQRATAAAGTPASADG